LDILAQHTVAACVAEPWSEDKLFDSFRRAWPYRDLSRTDFNAAVALHTNGRYALLHRDGVNRRLLATRRARIPAVTSGGAIPDNADYQVLQEPDGTHVGSINEDFAIESNAGDIFQLGNTSWRILRVEPGTVRVADAQGQPPTLPFWTGEAPSRTAELSDEVASLRDECVDAAWVMRETGVSEAAAVQIADYVAAGRKALGTVPTRNRVVAERFFDEAGGMQLVIHAPFGGRVNRAWGLALRKRFCRGFGFELQAASNEEAIVLSLGPQHSFKLEDVFNYLHPNTAREVLIQALLPAPMFKARWKWNAQRSLLLERTRNGKRVPAPILRMRADDLLAAAFPAAVACPETLPGGDIEVPMDHPLVRQTVEDCLTEAMDVDGFLEVIRGLRDGSIDRIAVDLPEPSPFARAILSSQPYTFLDDAPLEERRTQAVMVRRTLDQKSADDIGALDPDAIRRVREEAWPRPENAEEVHEALLWMGFVSDEEAVEWRAWLEELGPRVVHENRRWYAAEASRDPKALLRGRLEAIGPSFSDNPLMLELEREGVVLRARIEGREAWCDRRLLARIHRYTIERLRREIEPVTASEFLRFLACWQHADDAHRLEGPRGVAEVIRQLEGFEVPAAAWEGSVLPARVRGYRREWLDQLTLSGEVTWGRLWPTARRSSPEGSGGGGGSVPLRTAPMCLIARENLDAWTPLAPAASLDGLSGAARDLYDPLQTRGAMFPQELSRVAKLLPAHLEIGLSELIARGLLTCDSFGALRWLMVPPSRRRGPLATVGRWSLIHRACAAEAAAEPPRRSETTPAPDAAFFVARALLRRTGVVFRKTVTREKIPIPWRDLARVFRTLEARGDIRGGRFVAGFDGEQYALPEAVELLRSVRRRGDSAPLQVSAGDPLNFRGILTPDERVSSVARQRVTVG
ncbi:MAG TPA: hypothetical protein VFT32_10555, partial [Candidatus Eisenbacteria bacterium]|nr:hypothetical protein [Candidatus Eisenbacteria bacterium]